MRRAALLALLLALPLAPTAGADHVYSHRYVFEGRLVGSDDLPIPGRAVEFFSRGADLLEPCGDGPNMAVTDQWGDFRFCFHAHNLTTDIVVGVRAGDAVVERPIDTAFRRTIVELRDEGSTGVAPEGWETTFRVAGRAWKPTGERLLEGVRVFGLAMAHEPIDVTVRTPEGNLTYRTRTDAYGDFDLVLERIDDPRNTTVLLEAEGARQGMRLDLDTHRTTAPLFFPREEGSGPSFPVPAPAATTPAPGSRPPPMHPFVLVGLALALVGALAAAKRKKKAP